jgi:hypothetical protein
MLRVCIELTTYAATSSERSIGCMCCGQGLAAVASQMCADPRRFSNVRSCPPTRRAERWLGILLIEVNPTCQQGRSARPAQDPHRPVRGSAERPRQFRVNRTFIGRGHPPASGSSAAADERAAHPILAAPCRQQSGPGEFQWRRDAGRVARRVPGWCNPTRR